MGYSLVKQPEPNLYRRVSCVAGVLRVSSKLGSSHRTLTTPVEAYAPPCKGHILPFWRVLTKHHFSTLWLRLSLSVCQRWGTTRHVPEKGRCDSARQRPNGGKLPSRQAEVLTC